jgi:hypothetical protein
MRKSRELIDKEMKLYEEQEKFRIDKLIELKTTEMLAERVR